MSKLDILATEDRRLRILSLLGDSAAYTASADLLQQALAGFGHRIGRDRVATDLSWLREQGLVTLEEIGEVAMATLTRYGVDVAEGTARVPGVARPRPE